MDIHDSGQHQFAPQVPGGAQIPGGTLQGDPAILQAERHIIEDARGGEKSAPGEGQGAVLVRHAWKLGRIVKNG